SRQGSGKVWVAGARFGPPQQACFRLFTDFDPTPATVPQLPQASRAHPARTDPQWERPRPPSTSTTRRSPNGSPARRVESLHFIGARSLCVSPPEWSPFVALSAGRIGGGAVGLFEGDSGHVGLIQEAQEPSLRIDDRQLMKTACNEGAGGRAEVVV